MWDYIRYRSPKAQDPVVRQIEKAGWLGFYLGFVLGILAAALLLSWG